MKKQLYIKCGNKSESEKAQLELYKLGFVWKSTENKVPIHTSRSVLVADINDKIISFTTLEYALKINKSKRIIVIDATEINSIDAFIEGDKLGLM